MMLLSIVIILFITSVFTVIRCFFMIVYVSGHSMVPTVFPGDRLLLLRYWPRAWLRQGQIVVGDLSKGPDYRLEPSLSAYAQNSGFVKRKVSQMIFEK